MWEEALSTTLQGTVSKLMRSDKEKSSDSALGITKSSLLPGPMKVLQPKLSCSVPPQSVAHRRWSAIPGRQAGANTKCNSYNRQQNCGYKYGPQRSFFGPAGFGDGAQAAAQVAEMMQNFAKSVNANTANSTNPSGFLPVDIEEQETQYLLIADIPGLQKSDLKISINQNEQTLKISGERQRAQSADKKSADGSDQKQQFRRQYERGMGKFQRTISFLPKDADLSAVSARVDRGVLTITVQKKDLAKDEEDIRIDID